MITAQRLNIRRDPEARMVPLYMDSALTQFRRLLDHEMRPRAKASRCYAGFEASWAGVEAISGQ